VAAGSRPLVCNCCEGLVKRALVLQHMDHDHPGRFADWFAEDGIMPHAVRLFEGHEIPSLAGFDFMFVLGGAQNTWQESEHTFLKAEKEAIREWVWDRAKPYWGICLGHQLLATALGGEVAPADHGEVGVFDVSLTADGEASSVLAGLPTSLKVMQWHHAEVKKTPQSARVLASSATTAVQALAIDDHAVSTQFHCEFTPQTVEGWASMPAYITAMEKELGVGSYDRVRAEAYPLMPQMAAQTRTMWEAFKRRSKLVSAT
jgi:GMP synthase-like glutamine amidotransferase